MFSMTITTNDPSKFDALIAALQNAASSAPLASAKPSDAYKEALRAFVELKCMERILGEQAANAMLKKFNARIFTDVRPEDHAALIQAAKTCIKAVTVTKSNSL